MLQWIVDAAAVLFELAVCFLSVRRFAALDAAHPLLETGQLGILFFFSAFLTPPALLLRRRLPRHAFALFLLKAIALAYAVLLVPRLDLGLLPVFLAFALILAIGLPVVGALVVHGALWLLVASMSGVFHLSIGADPTDLPLLSLSAFTLAALSVAARGLFDKWTETRRNERRLADDVVHLITVNMDLQTFATTVENRTLDEERKRISREIHDTVGYTLTTLKILFEAAKGVLSQDPRQVEPLINQGLDYTRSSLEEIRTAMRDLRQADIPAVKGLHLIKKLVDNFRSVTHMNITLEFSGTRHSYGTRIDEFLYKAVQENLTNAYRHGKASKVSIFLLDSNGQVNLMVRDNGQSTRSFVKGIGMSGMEERAAALGGTVEFVGNEYGFSVTARIPAPEKEGS